ncbi:glycosyltransferase [Candidatus Falkowbacteria bacterium]|nr:glycosyltransferase [Candidatus Falkowbacteria bacterium]
MKIAQVVCTLPPKAGGIGRVADQYADELIKLGHEVKVFLPQQKGVDFCAGKNYSVQPLAPIVGNGLAAVLPQLCWKLKFYDVVILHYPFFGSALLTALVVSFDRLRMTCALRRARRDGTCPVSLPTKFVVVYHMDVVLSGWKKVYEKIGRRLFLNFILNSADKIVSASFDYLENSNIKKYFRKCRAKFFEIPFGAADQFKPAPKDTELLARRGFVKTDKIVLFVGGLNSEHYFKGVDYLIDAIKLIGDEKIKALIVGSGNLKSEYERLVAEKNLTNRVKFSGFVSDEDLPKYYNLADAIILPSINCSEAFGIVLVEAMASGKPILASDLAGVRSVVENDVNGFVIEPKNSADIARKIEMLFADEARYKKFSENCLKIVEQKYQWNIAAKRLNEIILS